MVDTERPLPALPLHRPPQGTARTVLELTGEVMEAAFSLVGEGVILGSMPRFLEAFGSRNARYLQDHYVQSDANAGAVAALAPLNVVSQVTETPYELPQAMAHRTVKRLKDCEFLDAFADRSPFAKAMICRLHEAVYQGSVNGLVASPGTQGYRVDLRSRILFGDPHCDFYIESIPERPAMQQEETHPATMPSMEAAQEETIHFYVAILMAFLEYLHKILPEDRLRLLLADCADRVGVRLDRILDTGSTPMEAVRTALSASQRTHHQEDEEHVIVTGCPFARPIRNAAKRLEAKDRDEVRAAGCLTCTELLRSVAGAGGPDVEVTRSSSIALGDEVCRFHVQGDGR